MSELNHWSLFGSTSFFVMVLTLLVAEGILGTLIMSDRTFAIGDIHGELGHLERLLSRLPTLDSGDTLLFLGDYVDRGHDSAGVISLVREIPTKTKAEVIALRGSHEDAWLKVLREGWPEFVIVRDPKPIIWQRTKSFFETYSGKRVVFGHTSTEYLPQELSCYTPEDNKDLFARGSLLGIDTGCGHEGGFLTAIELPGLRVYESR